MINALSTVLVRLCAPGAYSLSRPDPAYPAGFGCGSKYKFVVIKFLSSEKAASNIFDVKNIFDVNNFLDVNIFWTSIFFFDVSHLFDVKTCFDVNNVFDVEHFLTSKFYVDVKNVFGVNYFFDVNKISTSIAF